MSGHDGGNGNGDSVTRGEPGNGAEAAEGRQTVRTGGGDPNLTFYFKDLSAYPLLTHAEEARTTRMIQALEVAEWVELLSYPPVSAHLLGVLRRMLGSSMPIECRRWYPAARRYADGRSRMSRRRWTVLRAVSQRIGERLRDLDCDRGMLEYCIGYVRAVPQANGSCPPALRRFRRAQRYARYIRDIAEARLRTLAEKRRFCLANLRLVVSVARRYHRGRMSLADMVQEGNIGLMKAIDRYDVRKGYRFSTYASWWIRHAINRSLADRGRAIRFPVHMLDTHQRVQRMLAVHAARWGGEPDERLMAEKIGIDLDRLREVRAQSIETPLSLDRPLADDEGRRFVDVIADESAGTPLDGICREDWCRELDRLLASIPNVEADIIRFRFGLADHETLTLREIGNRYNLSRERIRQLQEQALGRMRRQVDAAFLG